MQATAVKPDLLRSIMRRTPSPVTLITAVGAEEQRGITIGSFTSLSMDPPLISFNVEKDAQMHDVLAETDRFVVHLPTEEQAELCTEFAIPDRTGEEQFADLEYTIGPHGIPILKNTLAVIYCRKYDEFEVGDHTIIAGEVRDVEQGETEGRPLLYYNRDYRRIGRNL